MFCSTDESVDPDVTLLPADATLTSQAEDAVARWDPMQEDFGSLRNTVAMNTDDCAETALTMYSECLRLISLPCFALCEWCVGGRSRCDVLAIRLVAP